MTWMNSVLKKGYWIAWGEIENRFCVVWCKVKNQALPSSSEHIPKKWFKNPRKEQGAKFEKEASEAYIYWAKIYRSVYDGSNLDRFTCAEDPHEGNWILDRNKALIYGPLPLDLVNTMLVCALLGNIRNWKKAPLGCDNWGSCKKTYEIYKFDFEEVSTLNKWAKEIFVSPW